MYIGLVIRKMAPWVNKTPPPPSPTSTDKFCNINNLYVKPSLTENLALQHQHPSITAVIVVII
jgi:hypothetical protein